MPTPKAKAKAKASTKAKTKAYAPPRKSQYQENYYRNNLYIGPLKMDKEQKEQSSSWKQQESTAEAKLQANVSYLNRRNHIKADGTRRALKIVVR